MVKSTLRHTHLRQLAAPVHPLHLTDLVRGAHPTPEPLPEYRKVAPLTTIPRHTLVPIQPREFLMDAEEILLIDHLSRLPLPKVALHLPIPLFLLLQLPPSQPPMERLLDHRLVLGATSRHRLDLGRCGVWNMLDRRLGSQTRDTGNETENVIWKGTVTVKGSGIATEIETGIVTIITVHPEEALEDVEDCDHLINALPTTPRP